jgi:hypothetical protein
MCFEFWHELADISMRDKIYFYIRQPMLKLKTHSGLHDLFLKYVIDSYS